MELDPLRVHSPINATDIIQLIGRLAEEGDLPAVLRSVTLTGNTMVADLGLDSLGSINLLEELSRLSAVPLDDDAIEPSETITELATRINAIPRVGAV